MSHTGLVLFNAISFMLYPSRIAQSLTWCLITLWISGWPTHRQKSVSLCRSCTMPARNIVKGKQWAWKRRGKWEKCNKIHCTPRSDLVPMSPPLPLDLELCRHNWRVNLLSDNQSSLTVSPNSPEVIYYSHSSLWYSGHQCSFAVPLFAIQMPVPWTSPSTAAKL